MQSFETDVGGREAEVDEVLGNGVVILGVDVGDEFEEGVLEIGRDAEGHAPVEDAEASVGGAEEVSGVGIAGISNATYECNGIQ